MKNQAAEFKDRTVFITGADGFVGSHLAEKMVAWDADVRVFIRAASSGELKNIAHLIKDIKVYRGDLTDKHSVDTAVKELKDGNDTIIFHLAAQAHVGESWERPYQTIQSNVVGTLNLLQSLIDYEIRFFKLDTAGTSEEYGNINEGVRSQYTFTEEGALILHEYSPVNPKSLYATSKLAADFLTINYHEAYGIPALTTRMFNNYGPRQSPRYITGTIITQALMRQTVELGCLKTKRDFCYVQDGISGHIQAALFGEPGQVYVYGQGENIAIEDWLRLIIKIGQREGCWGQKDIVINPLRFRPGTSDVAELRVDYKKLHRLTGWQPEFNWEQGISETIAWYAKHKDLWIGRVDWEGQHEGRETARRSRASQDREAGETVCE
ncbi:MAG: GDP-mannose 4,6-dehydratase [Acidobacteria bacterium]|nr:GDP-mannose 4,6-dehydratase [Acidobacteriota bacterium]MBI3656470.1 GDP-mannose 4,6-dehydratase [Acidobacteriota bacterium]